MKHAAQLSPEAELEKRIPLSQMRAGDRGVIRSSTLAEQDWAMLSAMGLRCDSTVRLCREGEPCIVSVLSGGRASCRIGLTKPLAKRIIVEPLPIARRDA